ncbi:MAG: sulfite exporter TauE/SafE family protein [Balneolales bacterium]
MFTVVLVIVGILAGVLAGMLGIGGGIIFAPILYYVFELNEVQNPELWTIGSSLFCTTVTSLSGTLKHFQMNNIFIKESIRVGCFGVLGTIVGKTIATSAYFNQDVYITLFSILLLYTGGKFIHQALGKKVRTGKEINTRKISWPQSINIGTGGGVVASLAGVGGGLIMVPVMSLYYKLPFPKTVSISESAIVIISFSGAFQLALSAPEAAGVSAFALGYVDFGASFALVIGAFAGANLGAWLHDRINLSYMQILFGFITFSAAGKMIYDAFFQAS